MINFNKTRSKFLWILAFAACFFSALPCQAHNGTIKGIVLDSDTKVGLPGANVELVGHNQNTFTDELGIFSFADLEAGKFQVKISYIGFETTLVEVQVKDHETTPIKIPLNAKELNLPDVEITAAQGSNYHTISALDIQTRPVNTSQDILRIVPGLVIAQHAGGGKAEQIFLRGFDIDHGTDLRISVDGMPVNMVSHAHGQGYADLHWLIPELVRNVDFAKGTYEASAGDFATAGYVNFNTAAALNQSMVKLEGGQFDTWRLVGAFDLLGNALKSKNQNAYIASEYAFSNSYFDSPQNLTRFNLMGKYNGLISENQSVMFSFTTFKSQWDHSGQIPLRAIADGSIGRFGAIDDTEGGSTSRTNLNLVFMKNLSNRVFFKNQLYLLDYDFELYSNFTFFLNDPLNGDQIHQKEHRRIAGYNGSWKKESLIGGKRLITEAGIQLRYDEVKDNELSRTKNRRETLENLSLGNVEEANAAVFIKETLELAPGLKLDAALRYDQFYFAYTDQLGSLYDRRSQMKGTFSPKLNLHFSRNPRWQAYLNAGMGFHSNDARVVIAQSGREILPQAYGLEAGILLKPFRKLLLNCSLWLLDLDQEFVYVGDEGIVEPSGRTRRRGFDLSARWQIASWLFADADFNYTIPRTKDEPDGQNYIPLAPTLTSIGGITATTKTGLFGSLRYRFVGDRPANEDNSLYAEGQFITDLLIGWRKPKYEISLGIQNLFDTDFNEAQFETTSRLQNEPQPVTELHFTPGTPFFLKGSITYLF
jgi:outer membrane receptor protein involved in Fe transport